ncbi:pore-forming ESAT-6 family protein [Streptomyces buecherae]|uniref:Pore-forming ESAT-6 family protein n=2 Tax=Streptomyces TaxID=1883 RepID=A0A7G8KD92_9ACTN|nr:pore-forming ESAT-6 family protein [Streptomyces buecherae]MBC3981639.1 pore-forming ESAT-6 family protein [Streptomyces buecherae]QKW51353.1 pore-forming ESAT-6 family protein [Streptomyces buecherae]QNJ41025.1 pore-forming ESAT-6 family protein [Streptomyces buecherae]
MGANSDRNSYDGGASSEVQGSLGSIVARLEAVITDRDRQVKAAMADFQADGVSDQYHAAEQRWNRSASEVREIIRLVRTTLEKNDGTAQSALSRAKSAVDGIG